MLAYHVSLVRIISFHASDLGNFVYQNPLSTASGTSWRIINEDHLQRAQGHAVCDTPSCQCDVQRDENVSQGVVGEVWRHIFMHLGEQYQVIVWGDTMGRRVLLLGGRMYA